MTHLWPQIYKSHNVLIMVFLQGHFSPLLNANKTVKVEFDVTAAAILSSSNRGEKREA